jgi:hypothetical protein
MAMIAAVLGLLAVPAGAEAKGLKSVEVCGQDACSKTSMKHWNFERRPLIFPPKVMSGKPDEPPKAIAPWYRVTVALAHANGEKAHSVVAPEIKYVGGRINSGFVWEKLKPRALQTYLHLTKGLEPNPAETMPGSVETQTGA